jgi:hypothetical protein
MIIAADRMQARIIKRYIAGLLRSHPSLAQLIAQETQERIWLTNGLCIEIHTCSWKSVRGYTCIGAAVDEIAFWDSEDAANPDHEVLVALKAAMASVPEAMLIALTSVYARRGEVWRMFDRYFGKNDSADILVVNGPTRTFNPTINPKVIEAARADDPTAAETEYDAEFRRDLEAFISREVAEACIVRGCYERPPIAGVLHEAFADPAGGSGADYFDITIAHREDDYFLVDCSRETKPPFSPATVVAEYAALLKSYGCTRVTGDRYAGEWPREQFRMHGIEYVVADRPKSDLYRDLLPLLNSGHVRLLDDPRMLNQLLHLERHTGRSGKDLIDHAPRQHDDLINTVAGAILACMTHRTAADNARDARAFAAVLATQRPSKWGPLDGSTLPNDGLPVRSAEYDPDSEDGDQIYTYRFM